MAYDVGLNVVHIGADYIILYAQGGGNLFPPPWQLKCESTYITTLYSNGECTVSGLSYGSTYNFYLYDNNGVQFGHIKEIINGTDNFVPGGGGGITPDPDPNPGGGTTPVSWALGSYQLTSNSAQIEIINNSVALQTLTLIQLVSGISVYGKWEGTTYLIPGTSSTFNLIIQASLSPNTSYQVYVNSILVGIVSYSNSASKIEQFQWKTSTIQKGYPLKITASDWGLLQNKITEVYTYIKSAIKPVWTTVIKGTTPISAEIYNEVADMINGLWYGTYDHYVDRATQKQTKLTAEIFNNLSTELNNYIARLT